MKEEEILQIITDNFLCVRRLPFEVISVWNYRDGDEERLNKPTFLSDGSVYPHKREIITNFGNYSPEKKFIKETKIVDKGGWWYVKEVKDTDSTIRFNREYDKFFAPTLEEAIKLYLASKE